MKEKTEKRPYLEREISWMYFNHRVLQEAQDTTVPLLERLSFLGIYSNNLDEFFRVRVAILNRIIALKDASFGRQKKTARQSLSTISKLNEQYAAQFDDTFQSIKKDLEAHGVFILDHTQIDERQRAQVLRIFREKLSLHLYPRMFRKEADFKDLEDDNVYLAIRILTDSGRRQYALLDIREDVFGRFIELHPDEPGIRTFMFLDDVIRICLPHIFIGHGFSQIDAYAFKLTKDAEMDIDLNGEDLLEKIGKAVKQRKLGQPVRFVYDSAMPDDLLQQIRKTFDIKKTDNVTARGRYHNLKDLMSFPDCGKPELKYPVWPALLVSDIMQAPSVIEVIRKQDILLHYPYHSFSNYIRLLREAAISPDVTTLKITLYRLARNSSVAEALICAAKNGKKVTVVIELLARFDEQANIYWTERMREAGIKVVLGIEGLKIHSKLTLIKGSRGSVACINTGNFHEGNARSYTDLTLMTAERSLVREVEQVFQFIQKPYTAPVFGKLLVSPINLRQSVRTLIQNEITHAKKGKPAYIRCKLNHLTDRRIIEKLYEASAAGVKIDLLVRGSCSVIPGISGISDNITIKGIIDRYLEHSRILIFGNGGKPKYYLGSADWICRNFDGRVEVMAPVSDEKLQRELRLIVDYGLRDNRKARIIDRNGTNQIDTTGEPFRSQEELYKHYTETTVHE